MNAEKPLKLGLLYLQENGVYTVKVLTELGLGSTEATLFNVLGKLGLLPLFQKIIGPRFGPEVICKA